MADSRPTANSCLLGLCIRLNPQQGNMDEYEAFFVDGPLADTRLRSKISTMTQSKWDECYKTSWRWECPGPMLEGATRSDIVRAVIYFLEMAMARKLVVHYGGVVDGVEDIIACALKAVATATER